jgi:hypothetical protein
MACQLQLREVGGAKWVMLWCLLVFNDSDELIAFC